MEQQIQTLGDLRTPAFIVDEEKLQRNCQQMIDRAKKCSVQLRPHIKTHKTIEIAYFQLYGTSTPLYEHTDLRIVVSTLGEANFYAAQKFTDILYAVPLPYTKFGAVHELAQKYPSSKFSVLIDNRSQFDEMVKYADAHSFVWNAFVDIDPGYHRSGFDPQGEEVLEVIKSLLSSPTKFHFMGIYTHAGHSYKSKNSADECQYAISERDVMSDFAAKIQPLTSSPFTVAVGSTPTCSHLPTDMKLVNEIHPGNYVFYDRMQALMGSCSFDDCAGTVVTTVIGQYQATGRLLVDAGALALSKDLCSTATGFGAIMGDESLEIVAITQEVGIIESKSKSMDFRKYPIGSRIRIIPNHSCLTAACFPRLYVISSERDLAVKAVWQTCPREW